MTSWMNTVRLLTVVSFLLVGITVYTDGKVPNDLKRNPQKAATISEGLQLSLETENQAFSSGEPVLVTIVLKNVSAKERRLVGASPYKIYEFVVKDEKGVDAPLTAYGKNLAGGADHLERGEFILRPGEEKREQIEIGKLFEIGNQGTYSVTARRTVFKIESYDLAELVSNTIDFTILN